MDLSSGLGSFLSHASSIRFIELCCLPHGGGWGAERAHLPARGFSETFGSDQLLPLDCTSGLNLGFLRNSRVTQCVYFGPYLLFGMFAPNTRVDLYAFFGPYLPVDLDVTPIRSGHCTQVLGLSSFRIGGKGDRPFCFRTLFLPCDYMIAHVYLFVNSHFNQNFREFFVILTLDNGRVFW